MKKTKVLFTICAVGIASLIISCSNAPSQNQIIPISAIPEDPGENPEDNGENPEDPGENPGDNGENPEDPGENPEDNGETTPENNPIEYQFHETVEYLPAGTDGSAGTTGTYVLFGDWPQTIKAQNVEIDTTRTMVKGGFTYYKGSDLNWYVSCRENAYEDGYTYSNRMTVAMSSTNSSKYFKIEPIKWRVLNPNAAEGEKKILLAEKCLTANIPYYGNNDYSTSYGANRYKFSNVRAYLNGIPNQWITDGRSENDYNIDWSGRGFLQSAFTNAAISLISDTVVRNDLESTGDINNTYTCDNTTDKIFLPSLQEITNSDYAFQPSFSTTDVNRKRESTDYAKANYCNSTVMYFLRSPSKLDYDRCKCVAGADGKGRVLKVIKSDNALVPALCLNE